MSTAVPSFPAPSFPAPSVTRPGRTPFVVAVGVAVGVAGGVVVGTHLPTSSPTSSTTSRVVVSGPVPGSVHPGSAAEQHYFGTRMTAVEQAEAQAAEAARSQAFTSYAAQQYALGNPAFGGTQAAAAGEMARYLHHLQMQAQLARQAQEATPLGQYLRQLRLRAAEASQATVASELGEDVRRLNRAVPSTGGVDMLWLHRSGAGVLTGAALGEAAAEDARRAQLVHAVPQQFRPSTGSADPTRDLAPRTSGTTGDPDRDLGPRGLTSSGDGTPSHPAPRQHYWALRGFAGH